MVANGKPVFVNERDAARPSYSTPHDVAGEREALVGLALDPEAYLTRAQAKERRAAEAV